MTASQMAAFVIMAETLQGLIDQETNEGKVFYKKVDDLHESAEDRDYTPTEEQDLEKWEDAAQRADDNYNDLCSIKESIECLMHEDRGNPR